MRTILAQLNEVISELENKNLIKEAEELQEIFVRVAKKIKKDRPDEQEGAPKSPPKGYPKSKTKYADPVNFKYPIDTEEHVRAALSYIGQARNRAKYTAKELAYIEARIHAAAKKFDIEHEHVNK
jgi:hypothetical protein